MTFRISAAALLALGLAIAPHVRADDDPKKSSESSGKSSDTATVRGYVAGVTVEGETIIDPRARRIVEVEAAFLTVVASPRDQRGGDHRHQDAKSSDSGSKDKDAQSGDSKDQGDRDKDKQQASGGQGRRRANVYMVWLTPGTKVCTCADDSGKHAEKKECSLAKLEIGDRVEIQYTRRDDSSGPQMTDSMKAKHGRGRIYSVAAREITILPDEDEGSSSSPDSKDKDSKSQDSKDKSNSSK